MFDPAAADEFSGQISLLNDPRETLGAALKYLGWSLNTTDQAEIDEQLAALLRRLHRGQGLTPSRRQPNS